MNFKKSVFFPLTNSCSPTKMQHTYSAFYYDVCFWSAAVLPEGLGDACAV